MNRYHRVISALLLVLFVATIVGLARTSRPIVESRSRPSYRNQPFYRLAAVTLDQFDTARKLAASAATREEQWMAREALRIADNEVDLAFATALQEATEHPSPLSPEAQAIADRLKQSQAQLELDRVEVERLTKAVAGAKESGKDALQAQLQLVQAQSDLDQDEVDDAHQDLIRAGGDPRGIIERMKQRYEAREQASGGLQALVPSGAQASADEPPSRSLVALARAWYALEGKIGPLQEAEAGARAQAEELTASHEKLREGDTPRTAPEPAAGAAKVSALKRRAADRKASQVFGKRVEDETQLADTYKRWASFLQERARQGARRILYGLLWILVIAAATTAVDVAVGRSLAKVSADRRQTRTLHSVAGYGIRAGGAILVLLVIFGPPTQFAAVLALAGAGLTVALKDFILAFLGWLVLMGRNGIRAGDWVEINGVSGEVLEIGPMRTILLETGNWSDAGHPTGRKVAFMNGFAVEGNYFNFSTSGQWMWDEVQFAVPADIDPFAMAETVSGMVAAETRQSAELAIDEWRRVAPGAGAQAFRGEPVTSVRPTGTGATLLIRYVTRANERHEVRSRIYREMIELRRRGHAPPAGAGGADPAVSKRP